MPPNEHCPSQRVRHSESRRNKQRAKSSALRTRGVTRGEHSERQRVQRRDRSSWVERERFRPPRTFLTLSFWLRSERLITREPEWLAGGRCCAELFLRATRNAINALDEAGNPQLHCDDWALPASWPIHQRCAAHKNSRHPNNALRYHRQLQICLRRDGSSRHRLMDGDSHDRRNARGLRIVREGVSYTDQQTCLQLGIDTGEVLSERATRCLGATNRWCVALVAGGSDEWSGTG